METKPLITTLRACIAHGGALPVSKLLPELVVMIANELKDDVYAQKAPGWHKGRKCALNECQGRDHYTNNQLRRRLKDDVTPDTEEEVLDAKGGTSRHEARIEEHLREIKPSGLLIPGESALKFIKCQNVSLLLKCRHRPRLIVWLSRFSLKTSAFKLFSRPSNLTRIGTITTQTANPHRSMPTSRYLV